MGLFFTRIVRHTGGTSNLETIVVSDEVMRGARKLRRAAIEELVRAHYARICRIAYGLLGRVDRGQRVAREVIKRSLAIAGTWENQGDAANWFLHHTVLESRMGARGEIDPKNDCLISGAGSPGAEYEAFVRGLRKLTAQQQEAFLLSFGEKLDPRGMAIAMDCSMAAAVNHLVAARKMLEAIAGEQFDSLTASVAAVYAALTPEEDLVVGNVSGGVGRYLARRRLRRMVRVIVPLIVVAALVWAGWWVWRKIEI